MGSRGKWVSVKQEKWKNGNLGFWESVILAREVSEGIHCVRGMRSERSEPLRAREESQPAGLE